MTDLSVLIDNIYKFIGEKKKRTSQKLVSQKYQHPSEFSYLGI